VQARYTSRDVELYGETVAKDSIVLLLNGSANRDERRVPDGERFDVHRPEIPHLSFGHGLHYCLGAALARLEGRVALEEFLQRWPTWEVDLVRANKAHTGSVRGWEHLPVVVS
jgi:cytochrome P450